MLIVKGHFVHVHCAWMFFGDSRVGLLTFAFANNVDVALCKRGQRVWPRISMTQNINAAVYYIIEQPVTHIVCLTPIYESLQEITTNTLLRCSQSVEHYFNYKSVYI